MGITFRQGTVADAPACGHICFEAFAQIADAHNFPRDFPAPEVSVSVLSMMLSHRGYYVVVAECDGEIIGTVRQIRVTIFGIRVSWPAAVAAGVVEQVTPTSLRIRKLSGGRPVSLRLVRKGVTLTPLVQPGERIQLNQIIAAAVPVTTTWPCPGGATAGTYIQLVHSTSLSDRYAAAKTVLWKILASWVYALEEY